MRSSAQVLREIVLDRCLRVGNTNHCRPIRWVRLVVIGSGDGLPPSIGSRHGPQAICLRSWRGLLQQEPGYSPCPRTTDRCSCTSMPPSRMHSRKAEAGVAPSRPMSGTTEHSRHPNTRIRATGRAGGLPTLSAPMWRPPPSSSPLFRDGPEGVSWFGVAGCAVGGDR